MECCIQETKFFRNIERERQINTSQGNENNNKIELVSRSVKDEFNNNKKVEKKLKREFYYGKGVRI